jgi:ABC-2 type transport system permease protein
VAAATFAGVALGSVVGGLGMDLGNVAAACTLQMLTGLVFGSIALALSAGTGRKSVSIWGAVGAAIVFHMYNSLAMLNDTLADWAWVSPYHYYIGNDPLVNGMAWGDAAVLVALIAVLVGASFVLFQRRDLRQAG